MKSYSQDQQDVYLYDKFFRNIKNGFYVDIGAHDGVNLSNTYFYELLGWTGICIEPLKSPYSSLIVNRNCKCINGVISDKDDEYVDFCSIEGYSEMLSGIIDNYNDKHKQRIVNECNENQSERQKIKVKNYKFSDVVDNYNINFLDIDTEGNELNILKTIDYDRYNIHIISVEDNALSGELEDFLISKKFIYVSKQGGDCVFKNPFFNINT